MSKTDRSSLRLRAQEIINANADGMTVRQALKQAALERYGDNPEMLAEAFATAASSAMADLRRRTYELPDDAGTLFEIPAAIGIRTDEGDLLVPRDRASLAHVRQWQREGQQHHSTQLLRFKRAGSHLHTLKDEDEQLPWAQVRHMIAAGESEDECDDAEE
ncbi:MAG: hypothetical protein ACRDQG_12120 [Pseudonocardiaceae bacterium]